MDLILAVSFDGMKFGKLYNLSVKKAECRRIDAFELRCWRRLLRVPSSNHSILKKISPGCSLEAAATAKSFQSCLTLCVPMNCRPPVHHQLPEFTQTHIHRVSDAIQPSHPLSSPSPPAHNPSQHQNLFQ